MLGILQRTLSTTYCSSPCNVRRLRMIIGVIREPDNEARVSLLPDAVQVIVGLNNRVLVEQGAGASAFVSDEKYRAAGAEVVSRQEVLSGCRGLLAIHPLSEAELDQLSASTFLLGVYQPLVNQAYIQALQQRSLVGFSMDSIPRITRAQSMDVLSSMSTVSGYKAVLLAAAHLPRFFPMLMTAAGTVPPAKVLVLGAGVAGLQAIATARRLGAVVEAFDTRLSVKEQVESLGAKFVEVEGAVEDKAAGGYAVEQSDDFKQRQHEAIHRHVAKSDVVITTALIPGKPAPKLITTAMLDDMRAGSVVVDLAAVTGGNCEVTKNNETVVYNSVSVIGSSVLPSTMPEDASRMYGKNVVTFLKLLLKDGEPAINLDDEIIRGTRVTGDATA